MDGSGGVSQGFSENAGAQGSEGPDASALREALSAPLGVMLAKMGAISPEQQEQSAQKQALMVAVRNALEMKTLAPEDLPQFKGEIDFLALSTMKDHEVMPLLTKGGIDAKEIHLARRIVDSNAGVNNKTEQWKVPMIGQIHAKMHGNQEIAQAALAVQQAIRAEDTALRLQSGQADPSQHEGKREFNFANPKDDQRVKDAVEVHRRLSLVEKDAQPGTAYDISAHLPGIKASYADAAAMFEQAGLGAVAAHVRIVAQSRVSQFHQGGVAPEGPGGAG
ncbi:MAG: hypothetical protein KJ017_10765 [Alphaproteobacteria bacterium]|nr:hypothetical protein [Alphaproteobacteria bacterium]